MNEREHGLVGRALLDLHRRADLQVLGVVGLQRARRAGSRSAPGAEQVGRREAAERVGLRRARPRHSVSVCGYSAAARSLSSAGDAQRRVGDVDAAQDHRRERRSAPLGACSAASSGDLLGEVRGRRERDRAAQLQLGRVLRRERRRPQRGLAALRVAGDARRACRCRVSSLRAARTMSSTLRPSERADQVRVRARRAEALVVGAHDRVAGLQPALQQRVGVAEPMRVPSRRARARTGRRCRSCRAPSVMTGQPPFGALPFGTVTVPDTATGLAVDAGRAVEQQPVAGAALERRRARSACAPRSASPCACRGQRLAAACRTRRRPGPCGPWRRRRPRGARRVSRSRLRTIASRRMAADPNPRGVSCAGMRRAVLVLAALAGAATTGATASAATPASRRGDLGLARVRRASPGLLPHRRGQVRHRRGQGRARDHRDATASGPMTSATRRTRRLLDTLPAARDPRRERLLAGRGHGDRRPPQADHRRARSPPRRRRPGELPGHRARSARRTATRSCRSGFYVISYADPREPRAGRRLRRAAGGPHDELHRRLQLRVDRRPGAPRRPGLPRARSRPAARGDGRPIWVTDLRNPAQPEGRSRADRPLAQRRADRLLARRRRRRQRASPGSAAAAACSATRPGAGGATRGPTRCARRQAVGSDPGRRRRHRGRRRTASPSRRPTSSTTRPGRPTARCAPPGVADGNVVADDRGGLHRARATRAAASSPRTSPTRSAASRRPTRRRRSRSG